MKQVNLYIQSFFGFNCISGRLLDSGFIKYCQFENAPYFTIIRKYKRRPNRFILPTEAFFLTEGEAIPPCNDLVEENGDFVTKYVCYSPEYVKDMQRILHEAESKGLITILQRRTLCPTTNP